MLETVRVTTLAEPRIKKKMRKECEDPSKRTFYQKVRNQPTNNKSLK